MKIITKIKDYYDYVGKIYGEDDKIIYKRLDLTKDEYHDFKVKTTIPKSAQKLENIRTYIQGKHIHQLIICGFVYTVEKKHTLTNLTNLFHLNFSKKSEKKAIFVLFTNRKMLNIIIMVNS
jgi:hypothetical protein